jgi:hypothetical protein
LHKVAAAAEKDNRKSPTLKVPLELLLALELLPPTPPQSKLAPAE